MTPETLYSYILIGCLGLFSILVFIMIYRSIKGPGTSNRIIAINMLGTMVICSIAILAVYFDADYLIDICLIYAMISFLAVVVITKIMGGVTLEHKHIQDEKEAIMDNIRHQITEEPREDEDNGLL